MTKTPHIADVLGYRESSHYLEGNALEKCPDYAHVFRRARPSSTDAACRLQGVYVLRSHKNADSVVPVVYVCSADSDEEANAIHRRVWNQNVVPFLLVQTRHHVRLYNGFRYQRPTPTKAELETSIAEVSVALDEAATQLVEFRSPHIDNGRIWRDRGQQINPTNRVDWRLLQNLRYLADELCKGEAPLDRHAAHGLIGKYVYLNYLRARDILSDARLKEWGINAEDVFSADAKITVFRKLLDELDGWLNGSVFPFDLKGVQSRHLRDVAGAFKGDNVLSGQLHLDFPAFDFSYIPTETLSVMYEQFLHAPDAKGDSRGKKQGAYYTPIPVVNFMLAELEQRKPLESGMRVVDMSCGSGAFLVQAYRRLIEKERSRVGTEKLKPARLSKLLTDSIFGVDLDEDACRVAGLSLTMTLLDNVDPPDLMDRKTRCAPPDLLKRNILVGNAFDADLKLLATDDGFDWIVGNPPWGDIKANQTLEASDRLLLDWMNVNKKECPTGGYQKAEAFAWKALLHCKKDGVIGLLVPAMSLFKSESRSFRAQLIQKSNFWCVANFANLAEVLFAGRARVPAAALFYSPIQEEADDTIPVYSPLLANQESSSTLAKGQRKSDTWAVIVNAAEIRHVPRAEVELGDMLPWKVAAWGSPRDARVLRFVSRAGYPTLAALAKQGRINIAEGVQLRDVTTSKEKCIPVPELVGRRFVNVKNLVRRGQMAVFPKKALESLPPEKAYLRKRGGIRGLGVNKPPHILVGKSCDWAVYSDEYLIVPPRQVGISGNSDDETILKALSLYLLSDFAFYYQFFTSPEFGVEHAISTLESLKELPVPLTQLSSAKLSDWADLHARVVACQNAFHDAAESPATLRKPHSHSPALLFEKLINELNHLTMKALKLDSRSRTLIHDFVHVRFLLNKGKTTTSASDSPSPKILRDYASTLVAELNGYLSGESDPRCAADIVYDKTGRHAMVFVDVKERQKRAARVLEASETGAQHLRRISDQLRIEHAQWVYFNRGLRVYEGSWIYVFKPLQLFHFTVSQAMTDADEIIGDLLSAEAAQ